MSSCVKCGDICKCINVVSGDGRVIVERESNAYGCSFSIKINEANSFLLEFDSNTKQLCLKDKGGNKLTCTTLNIDTSAKNQTLILNGNVLSISNGNSITLPIPIITSDSLTIDVTGNQTNIEVEPSKDINNNLKYGTDGKLYATGGIFAEDIINNTSSKFGKYNSGQTIPAVGKTAEQVLKDILTELIPPIYYYPTLSLSSNYAETEIGAKEIPITLTATFNKNDGGNLTSGSIEKNGQSIASSLTYTDIITIPSSQISYTAKVSFGTGGIKNDNLGNPYPSGQIQAGTLTSNTVNIIGNTKIYYGTGDNSNIRSGESVFTRSSNNFILNTGTTENMYWVWLPEGKVLSSVIDMDTLNLDITDRFVSAQTQISDAGDGILNGTLYTMTNDVIYNTSHRFNITIN